jgi:hypothetical protein
VEQVLSSQEIKQTENQGTILYSIAPSQQAAVDQRIGSLIDEAMNKFADAGLNMWGIGGNT